MLTLRRSVRLWKRGNLPFLKKLCRCLEKTFAVEMVFPDSPRIPSRSVNEFLETINIISSSGVWRPESGSPRNRSASLK